MIEDLKAYGIFVNLLLPGGAAETGMIPKALGDRLARHLMRPEIMRPPIVFLASDAADGITGERIDALHWDEWRTSRQKVK